MRLLVLSRQFWPEGGGAELAAYLVTKLLAEDRELAITVLTGTPNPAKIGDVRFVVHPALRTVDKPLSWVHSCTPSVRRYFARLAGNFDTIYFCQLYPLIPLARQLLKRVVVHVHDYQPVSYNAVILAERVKPHFDLLNEMSSEAKYEILEHNSVTRGLLGSLLAPAVRMYRSWTQKADVAICVSRRQAYIISRLAPELTRKIKVIDNPLPHISLAKKQDALHSAFLYAGGDSYIKGFRTFLGASQKLLQKSPDAKFILTKDFRATSTRLLNKLNSKCGEPYVLPGFVGYEKMMKLHSATRALIFPSIWEEPWGYAIAEAMLSGTIPIASRVGGVAELVQDSLAEDYLFEPGNLDGLLERMESALSLSKKELNAIGAELRESVLRKFSNERTKEQLLEVMRGN